MKWRRRYLLGLGGLQRVCNPEGTGNDCICSDGCFEAQALVHHAQIISSLHWTGLCSISFFDLVYFREIPWDSYKSKELECYNSSNTSLRTAASEPMRLECSCHSRMAHVVLLLRTYICRRLQFSLSFFFLGIMHIAQRQHCACTRTATPGTRGTGDLPLYHIGLTHRRRELSLTVEQREHSASNLIASIKLAIATPSLGRNFPPFASSPSLYGQFLQREPETRYQKLRISVGR